MIKNEQIKLIHETQPARIKLKLPQTISGLISCTYLLSYSIMLTEAI